MTLENIGLSLGNICESAVYGTLNGLKPKKIDGYKTCPFDLCISNVNGIIECLNTDFKDFCNPKYLKHDTDTQLIRHTLYHFSFNHEAPFHADIYLKEKWTDGPYHFTNNNFKKFCERYYSRIHNLHNYCNGKYFVTFILQFQYDIYSDEIINKLNEAIKKRYPNLQYKIKLIEKNLYNLN